MTDPSGLVYLRARYYNPAVGMGYEVDAFTQPDPVQGVMGMSISYNPYPYAHTNPVNLTDPSGRFPPLLVAAAIAGGILGGAIHGYAKQVVENLHDGMNFSDAVTCIETNAILDSVAVGLFIGAGIGLSMGAGTVALGSTAGYSAGLGSGSAVLGSTISNNYAEMSQEEMLARMTTDMLIGGIFGAIWPGAVNSFTLSGRNIVSASATGVARAFISGGLNTSQGIVSRGMNSLLFDDQSDILSTESITNDFIIGFGLQAFFDAGTFRFARGGLRRFQHNQNTLPKRPAQGLLGATLRTQSLAYHGSTPQAQISATIFGTNMIPPLEQRLEGEVERIRDEWINSSDNR